MDEFSASAPVAVDETTGHPLGRIEDSTADQGGTFFDDFDDFGAPRRGPGRPRKDAIPHPPLPRSQRTVVTRQVFLDESGQERQPTAEDDFSPLFDRSEVSEKAVIRVRVTRRDPDEGMVGYLDDPMSGEHVIADQWGGSTYKLEGVNRKGQTTVSKMIKIAGDPIFKSLAAENTWRRSKGLPLAGTLNGGAAMGGTIQQIPQQPAMTVTEMLSVMNAQEDKRRKETEEANDRRRREDRDHQAHMRKMELDAEEKKGRDNDERLRARARDEEERDLRKRKDDEERDIRRRREQSEAEARQQQFMQQTITMIQQSSTQALQFAQAAAKPGEGQGSSVAEALKMIAMIKDTFGAGEGGETEDSTMQTLFKNLPAMLQGAGTAIGSAVREVKGGGVPSAQAQLPAQPASAGLLAALPAGNPLAAKLDTLVTKIALQGKDPEAVLGLVTDKLLAIYDAPQTGVAVSAGAVATAGAPGTNGATEPAKPFVKDEPPASPPVFASKAVHIGFPKAPAAVAA